MDDDLHPMLAPWCLVLPDCSAAPSRTHSNAQSERSPGHEIHIGLSSEKCEKRGIVSQPAWAPGDLDKEKFIVLPAIHTLGKSLWVNQ